MFSRKNSRVLSVAVTALLAACDPDATIETEAGSRAVVYGDDSRLELYQVSNSSVRDRVARAVVALIPRRNLRMSASAVVVQSPSWREADSLCDKEPFAEQPAAAFCSGVLIDWDLVLTAGHCARVFAPEDFLVVFGYAYSGPGTLSLEPSALRTPATWIAEALDGPERSPRKDYAFLRLEAPVPPPYAPTAIAGPSKIVRGTPLISASASGGVPLKLDLQGTVLDARAPSFDYFTADTDTARGASGGPAFDDMLALLGVLARGGQDFEPTALGCNATAKAPEGLPSGEEYSFARTALDDLCFAVPGASSLCRAACGDPCTTAEARPSDETGGCSVAARKVAGAPLWMGVLAWLGLGRRRNRPGRAGIPSR